MARLTTVTYDRTARSDGKPYRSHNLYEADKRAAMQAKPGTGVQVIAQRGDTTWTDATALRWERVPHTDGSIVRFWVMINGTEHVVDQSRIRVP